MPPGTDLVVVFPVPAAVFQENDIGEIALVVGDESLERACITRAGVNDAVGSLWDGTQVSLRLIIPINGGAVKDPLALVRQIGQGQHVVDRRDGQRRFEGTRLGHRGSIRFGRVGCSAAIEGSVRGRPLIPRAHVDGDTFICQGFEHTIVDAAGLAAHATASHKRQVDDVRFEDEGVIERIQHCPVLNTAPITGYFCSDDLSVRRNAPQLGRVGGGDTSDVRPVQAVEDISRIRIVILVGIIVDIGDLFAHVTSPFPVREFTGQGLDVRLTHAHVNAVHGAGKGCMPYHQSCVDDFDNLAVALQAGLVGANHLERGGIEHAGVNGGEDGVVCLLTDRRRIVGLLDECCLNAFGGTNGLQGGGRCFEREAVERVAVFAQDGDDRAGRDPINL